MARCCGTPWLGVPAADALAQDAFEEQDEAWDRDDELELDGPAPEERYPGYDEDGLDAETADAQAAAAEAAAEAGEAEVAPNAAGPGQRQKPALTEEEQQAQAEKELTLEAGEQLEDELGETDLLRRCRPWPSACLPFWASA